MTPRRLIPILATALLAASSLGQLAQSPWPKYRGNGLNTGLSPNGGSNGQKRWSYATGGTVQSSPSIASDGTVYAGSNDGYLYAMNADGSLKWRFNAAGSFSGSTFFQSSPAVAADGTIYFGCSNEAFFAVNPNGTLKWQYFVEDYTIASPAIAMDGTIYTGTNGGVIRALNPDGTLKWSIVTSGNIQSSPAIGVDGTIYQAVQGDALYAINPDGSVKWKVFGFTNILYNSPAIGPDGTIYCPGGPGYGLAALTPGGVFKWVNPLNNGGGSESAPAIGSDGTIYMTDLGGGLFAINPDGSTKWATPEQQGYCFSSPVIGFDGTIYYSTPNVGVIAVSAAGSELWTFPLSQIGSRLHSSPAIGSDGTLYIGSEDYGIYAIGTQTNTIPVNSVSISPSSVFGGLSATGTITLSQSAPSGSDIVELKTDNPAVIVPAYVIVPSGSNTATFLIATTPVLSTTTANLTASSGGTFATATLEVQPAALISINIVPSSIIGGASPIGTVALGSPSPAGGLQVFLASDNAYATPPASVTISASATSATFTVATIPVSSNSTATITATLGTGTQAAKILVQAAIPATLTFAPATVLGGGSTTGTLTLNGLAPTAGTIVTLSSNSSCASPPASVTVPPGASSITFTVPTAGVSAQTQATVTASVGQTSIQGVITVNPAQLATLTLSPTTVNGGQAAVGSVTVTGPAPTAGASISLTSNNAVASVPSTVTIPAGAEISTFSIETSPVTSKVSATITASFLGSSHKALLVILPASLASVTIAPSTFVGGSQTAVAGTVSLSGLIVGAGATITLTSSNTKVLTVPSSIKIKAGQGLATFAVTHRLVSSPTEVTVTATYAGISRTATTTVDPFQVSALSVSPTSVVGGTAVKGSVTLNAIPGPGSGAVAVKLLSSLPAVSKVPSKVSVPVAAQAASFTVTTMAVSSSQTVTITGNIGTSSARASLTVQAPSLLSLSIAPESVKGSALTPVTGTVVLTSSAPAGGLVISLTSSNDSAASVPKSVTVSAGKTKSTFRIAHAKVSASTSVTVTARLSSDSKSATLTVTH